MHHSFVGIVKSGLIGSCNDLSIEMHRSGAMWTGRAAVRLAPALFVLAAPSLSSAAEEKMRFVLLPERTDLAPVKVSLAPEDETTLLAVKDRGGIRPLDLGNRGGPEKFAEIATACFFVLHVHNRTL
jgi:hypothetical protein